MIKILYVILLLLVFVSISLQTVTGIEDKSEIDNKYNLSPSELANKIEEQGARAVVKELYADYELWAELLNNIATGDREWLNIAILLRPGSDAGSSEMLALSVGEALENSPENVLQIALGYFSINTVCGAPDIDNTKYSTYEKALSAVEQRIKSIEQIKNDNLTQHRDRCVELLNNSIPKLQRFFGVEQKTYTSDKGQQALKFATILSEKALKNKGVSIEKLNHLPEIDQNYLAKISVNLIQGNGENTKEIEKILGEMYFEDQDLIPAKMAKINKLGIENNVDFMQFKPLYRIKFGIFTLIPIRLELSGKKSNVLNFVSSLSDFTMISDTGLSISVIDK